MREKTEKVIRIRIFKYFRVILVSEIEVNHTFIFVAGVSLLLPLGSRIKKVKFN